MVEQSIWGFRAQVFPRTANETIRSLTVSHASKLDCKYRTFSLPCQVLGNFFMYYETFLESVLGSFGGFFPNLRGNIGPFQPRHSHIK